MIASVDHFYRILYRKWGCLYLFLMSLWTLFCSFSMQIQWNEGLRDSFTPLRGPRHWCPLLLYLFVLCMKHLVDHIWWFWDYESLLWYKKMDKKSPIYSLLMIYYYSWRLIWTEYSFRGKWWLTFVRALEKERVRLKP